MVIAHSGLSKLAQKRNVDAPTFDIGRAMIATRAHVRPAVTRAQKTPTILAKERSPKVCRDARQSHHEAGEWREGPFNLQLPRKKRDRKLRLSQR
jgi:hypothetical protein